MSEAAVDVTPPLASTSPRASSQPIAARDGIAYHRTMTRELLPDLVAVLVYVGLLGVYKWRITARGSASGVTPHFIEEVRTRWIASVIEGKRDILAVQTLRNMLMAANFFASTAFFAAVGLLSFGIGVGHLPEAFDRISFLGSNSETFFLVKLLVIVGALFATFFNFALAIRYYNHVTLALNVPTNGDDRMAERVAALFRRGATHYSWGMRGYYYAIPLTLWLFGPLWMVAGTVLVLPLLHRHDHLPT